MHNTGKTDDTMNDTYHIHPMTMEYAREISTWTYEGPYAVYSFQPDGDTLAELTGGNYRACMDKDGRLAGFFCFGAAARIPTVEADAYLEGFLDIGLGMAPWLCGQGRGAAFLAAGMDYAGLMFPPAALRLTVAAFNRRAISVYQKLSFEISSALTHRISQEPFYLMHRISSAAATVPTSLQYTGA